MADKDNSIFLAAGNKIFRQMERLTAKQEKVANQQQQIVNEELRDKAQSVANIKSISETQGGKALTTQNVASLIKSIETTVVNRINQMSLNTTKQFLPIDSQLKRINDLISSNQEDDIDKGFQLIDRLQSKLGVDLSKYSKELGDAVQKLYDMNRQRKDDKAEAKRIQEERTEQLTRERDILRERGINTVFDEKSTKLQILTKRQEREELKRIQIEEREIEKDKSKARDDLKSLQKQDTITAKERNKILKDNEKITKREEDLAKAEDRIGLKPQERVSGPLDQTVGEAFRQIKTFGKEIMQLPKTLMGGFKSLAGFVGRVAMGFMALLLPLMKFVLIAIGVGVVIYTLYKVIKSVIDFFANIFEGISKIWPFSLLKKKEDKKNEEIGDKSKTKVPDDMKSETEKGKSIEKSPEATGATLTNAAKEEEPDEVADDFYRNTGMQLATRVPGRKLPDSAKSPILPSQTVIKGDNLNKMSVENQALSETKSANNTVVAPNISNSNVNASNTQVMSMEPTNFDRSFTNLNSVPI